ncbi:MAG: transporter [Proteobacteria bacterium]|nr:transporter [Pseudomonadota bacterium]
MKGDPGQALSELDRQIEQCRGDFVQEAELRAHKATWLTALSKWSEGATELAQAAELAGRAVEWQKQSEYLYGQGLLLARMPEQRGRAHQVWLRAASVAQLAKDGPMQIKAHRRIVQMYAGMADWAQAIAESGVLLRLLEENGMDRERVEALRNRAAMHQMRQRADRAVKDLARAVDLAQTLDDPALSLQTRLHYKALDDYLHPEKAGSLAELLVEAESLGDTASVAHIALEQAGAALRAGRFDDAQEHAGRAREAALDGPDPVRYLLACALIAEAREKLGDRAGVIEILLTCKGSLEDLLGPTAGQQVVVLLDSLEHRWGRDGVERALSDYRARAQTRAAGKDSRSTK